VVKTSNAGTTPQRRCQRKQSKTAIAEIRGRGTFTHDLDLRQRRIRWSGWS
jgi:hypothetical protein